MFGVSKVAFALCFLLLHANLFSVYTDDDFDAEEIAQRNTTLEGAFEYMLRKLLAPLDPIYIPLIPTIGGPGFSISFTDVNITGLSTQLNVVNVTIPFIPLPPKSDQSPMPYIGQGKNYIIEIYYPIVSVLAGQYSAGGHIYNMPFTGESYMSATFEHISLTIGMAEKNKLKPQCVEANSTTFQMDVRKPVVYFDQLNPGTDQGLLLNTIISSFVPDFVDYLQYGLNGPLHDTIDTALVNFLNSFLCDGNSTTANENSAYLI